MKYDSSCAPRFREGKKVRLHLFSDRPFPDFCRGFESSKCEPSQKSIQYFLAHSGGWSGYQNSFLAGMCEKHIIEMKKSMWVVSYEVISREDALALFILAL